MKGAILAAVHACLRHIRSDDMIFLGASMDRDEK